MPMLTKHQLSALLYAQQPKPSKLSDASGFEYTGILQQVQREDGSGRNFNVTLTLTEPAPNKAKRAGENCTIFLRTID